MANTRKRKTPKFVFVVGGVMSGVGKGIAAASIGHILQARGLKVTAIKIDPYINIDAGTMNPTEHGEVFVLSDGDETDQDMGNYERFLNTTFTRANYMTTGRVYQEVIRKERNLEYKGRNVEVVPDVPLEVIRRIEEASALAHADVTIIEIGGTIGEYQNILFLEAARMMKTKYPGDVAFVMVSYLPTPSKVGEMKTKPTQYAARSLNGAGIQADIIIARSETPIDNKRKEKIAMFCNVLQEHVISAPDVHSIYDVPLNFEKDRLGEHLCRILGIKNGHTNLSAWESFVAKAKRANKEVKIGVVGKYFNSGDFILSDVYISVLEALKISAYALGVRPNIDYIGAKQFEGQAGKRSLRKLEAYDCVLVPGGFGESGVEGKINVIEHCRTHNIPYFGICYGMQLAVIEYARNVLKMKGAHTTEIDQRTAYPVIDILPDQREKLSQNNYGGSMRLGSYECTLHQGTIARDAYGTENIIERHRHRFEVNPEYVSTLIDGGLIFSGSSPDNSLMEIVELPRNGKNAHPFFVGVQFHPEFSARPLAPHPLFSAFIKAGHKRRLKKSA